MQPQTRSVATNLPDTHQHVQDMLLAAAKGQSCFDFKYYRETNPDLAKVQSNTRLWRHFLNIGQFEYRLHRWTCALTAQDVIRKLAPEVAPEQEITE